MTEVKPDRFIIRNISVSNYYNDNEKVSGNVTIKNGHTETEIKMPLNAQDAADIIAIFANRIAMHMGVVAAAVIEELKPQPMLTAPVVEEDDEAQDAHNKSIIGDNDGPYDRTLDDEIPY